MREVRWARLFHGLDMRKCEELGLELGDLQETEILESLQKEGDKPLCSGPFTDLRCKSWRPHPLDDAHCIDIFLDLVT